MSQINVLENVEVPAYEDTWVTVFGFTPESSVISAVLQEFQACGNIQMWITPPASTCNWIYIQFEAKHAAQRALQRNGATLGLLSIRVGVQPPSYQDRQCIASQAGQAWTSAGARPALPERQYVLAPTAAKVRRCPARICTAGSTPSFVQSCCAHAHAQVPFLVVRKRPVLLAKAPQVQWKAALTAGGGVQEVKVPQPVQRTWTQRVSDVFFGS